MAITSKDMTCDQGSKGSVSSSKKYHKIDFPSDNSSLSICTSFQSSKSNKKNTRSPYLTGDRVQLFSRLTEKLYIHNTNVVSSFPLAMDLYKTNSDDFKPPKKGVKKVKKSVLTLPNARTPVPHACTESDMNDSEYFDKKEGQKRKVVKKRTPIRNKIKAGVRGKDFEFYDRDAQYCSQLNLDLDYSSTDMMKNFNGDGRRVSNKKSSPYPNKTQAASNNLNDVWAVLRNVNRYQFRPSPPMSEESIVPVKKKLAKKGDHKQSRGIGTCRTQEFAYISSYELNKKSPEVSPSSSYDRITVIDNHDDFSEICEEFEKQLLQTHDFLKDSNNSKNVTQKKIIQSKNPRGNGKASSKIVTKDNKQLMIMKKVNNLSPRGVQQIKTINTSLSSGKSSQASTYTLQHNNMDKCDMLSHKTTDEVMCPGKDSLISFDNSRSSKDESSKKITEHVSKNDIAVLHEDLKSTVCFSTTSKGLDPQPRKLRLLTMKSSSCVNPKLTQTEIKRRLGTMKFPIVVLGKDQVSSSIKVTDYNPPQFDGLDDHIWPFMIRWSLNPQDLKQDTQSKACLLESESSIEIKSKSRKSNIENGTYKQKAANLKDKKEANYDLTANKIKAKIRPTPEITDKSLQCIKKQKSIVQLKDKMLNFLYKKSSSLVNNESYKNDETTKHDITLCNNNSAVAKIKVPAVIDSQLIPDKILVRSELPEKKDLLAKDRKKHPPNNKYSWAKAKWASDFIENVMKKVRSGVYYTQDRTDFRHTNHTDLKEASVQAGPLCRSSYSIQDCGSKADFIFNGKTDTGRNSLQRIPGFDNTLPLLEIKTLNMNQIAVKHCVTNSMVQFDVTIPVKSDQNITSVTEILPLTPIAITESQTVIYKCTTTILNAMLPAELCSLLPKMMSSIISNKSSPENSALNPPKTHSWLSTITELARSEIRDSQSIVAIKCSPEIKEILEGRFSNVDCNKQTLKKKNFNMKYDQSMVTELQIVPLVLLNKLYKVTPLLVELDNSHSQESLYQSNKKISDVTDIQNTTFCTSLQTYTCYNETLPSAFKPNKLVCMIERMTRSHNLQIHQNLSTNFDMLKLQYDGKNVKINMSLTNGIGVQKKVSVTVSNLNIDSLCKALPKIENGNKRSTPLECIEYVKTPLEKKSHHTEQTKFVINKIKRKGFSKLYRKFKTTSISSGAKGTNTAKTTSQLHSSPIDEITTAEDLFQILGSKKIFSSVLDDNAAKKILSSVTEMKNWTSEINPKQALLIILLANKKDTQNLVRFRPIILQGIAVNRITLATELDMEIEVIERENFNKPPQQCEGITYLPETVTDYENLLDELYWIAKTTASDYNKPFNESSERLLKSLLQKRKRLNPSYLRVMARYVGLGLVKTPTEC